MSGPLDYLVAKNVGISAAIKLASLLSGMAMQIVLARSLGLVEFGKYAFVWSGILILLITCKLGLDIAAVRFVAQYRVQEEWSLARGFISLSRKAVLVASSVVAVITVAVVWILPESMYKADNIRQTILFGFPVLPAYALVMLQTGILRGLGDLSLALITQDVLFPLVVSATVPLISIAVGGIDTNDSLLICGFVLVAILILQYVIIAKKVNAATRTTEITTMIAYWLRTSTSMMLSSGITQVMMQLDILLIGAFFGLAASGVYSVAKRISRLINMGLQISNLSTAHMLSELYSEKRLADFQRVVSWTSLVSTVTTLPIIVLLYLFPEQVLSLFGEGFSEEGTLLLHILLLGQAANAVSGPNGVVMYMTGYQNEMLLILVSALVINIGAVFIFIPYIGVAGVALAATVAVVARNIITTIEVKRRLGVNTTVFSLALLRRSY